MAWRKGHGNGAGVPRIEVMPADELPVGMPGDTRGESPTDRGEGGRFARGNTLARKGGRAKGGKTRLAERLGLSKLADEQAFAPYKRSAKTFARAKCAELAATVGGGFCGPGVSAIVGSAALALAWSRFLSDQAAETGDADLALKAARLAETSRQHLMAAHELCAKEALARPKASALESLRAAILDEGKGEE